MVLRELFAKLGLDVDAQSFMKGNLAARAVEASLAKLGQVVHEVMDNFQEMIAKTAEGGKELKETSQSTGLTTEALQQLRKAAGMSGVSTEMLDTSLFRMSRSMQAAHAGSKQQAAAFAKLGVHTTGLNGKLRATDETFMDIADRLSGMEDGTEKTAMAMGIFGRAGARLIPLLNKGRDGIDELRASAYVMSEEQIEAGEQFVITQKAIAATTANLWKSAIAPLLPAMTQLLKRYLAWRKENAGIMKQKIQEYIGGVVKGINVLADVFKAMTGHMGVVKVMMVSMIALFGLMKIAAIGAAIASGVAWFNATAPFIALLGILIAIVALLDEADGYMKGEDTIFSKWENTLKEWLQPHDDDVWWLKALRAAGRELAELLGIAEKLGIATGGKKNHPNQEAANAHFSNMMNEDRQDMVAKGNSRFRIGGAPVFERNWLEKDKEDYVWSRFGRARDQGAGIWDATKGALGFGKYDQSVPTMPSTAAGGGQTRVVQQSVQMSMSFAPGYDPKEVGAAVDEALTSHYESAVGAR